MAEEAVVEESSEIKPEGEGDGQGGEGDEDQAEVIAGLREKLSQTQGENQAYRDIIASTGGPQEREPEKVPETKEPKMSSSERHTEFAKIWKEKGPEAAEKWLIDNAVDAKVKPLEAQVDGLRKETAQDRADRALAAAQNDPKRFPHWEVLEGKIAEIISGIEKEQGKGALLNAYGTPQKAIKAIYAQAVGQNPEIVAKAKTPAQPGAKLPLGRGRRVPSKSPKKENKVESLEERRKKAADFGFILSPGLKKLHPMSKKLKDATEILEAEETEAEELEAAGA